MTRRDWLQSILYGGAASALPVWFRLAPRVYTTVVYPAPTGLPPVLVWGNRLIGSGVHRLKAAKLAGLTK